MKWNEICRNKEESCRKRLAKKHEFIAEESEEDLPTG
jgi:hypothetical protein